MTVNMYNPAIRGKLIPRPNDWENIFQETKQWFKSIETSIVCGIHIKGLQQVRMKISIQQIRIYVADKVLKQTVWWIPLLFWTRVYTEQQARGGGHWSSCIMFQMNWIQTASWSMWLTKTCRQSLIALPLGYKNKPKVPAIWPQKSTWRAAI